MKKTTFTLSNLTRVLFVLAIILFTSNVKAQLVTWNATGLSSYGASPWPADVTNSKITVSGISRGSSIATTGAAAGAAFGGSGGWAENGATSDNNSFSFTITAKTGQKLNLTSISTATRRSGTGPTGYTLYYSINGGTFTAVAPGTATTSSTSGTTGTANTTTLSGIASLQNVAAGDVIKFRINPTGALVGNYYLVGGANSVVVNGTVVTAGPEVPATPVATAATSVSATGFTANWNAVTDATSYSLDVSTDISFDVDKLLPAYTALTVNGISQVVTTGVVPDITYYYRVVARNAVGGSEYSNIITVCRTAAPVAIAQTYCGATTVAKLTATGTDVKWYTTLTGGTALATTATVTSGTYYAAQTLNNCEGSRTAVTVTVNNTPAPTAPAQTFCITSPHTVANLTVTTGTDVKWYVIPTGSPALKVTENVVTGTYYVTQTLNNCESAATPVVITVNETAAPTIAAQVFCNAAVAPTFADVTIATGTAVKWYAALTGGAALDATTALATGTTYYASQTLNSCESTRTAVPVTINVTAAPVVAPLALCGTVAPTVASLTVTTGTDVKWYAAETGGVALDATTVLVTGTTYYASQTLNSCESLRIAVPVTINVTAAPVAAPLTLCGTVAPTVASLTVTTGTDVIWYAAETGGVALDATMVLVTGTTYYASQTLNSCESPRTAVPVTINITAAPVAAALTFCGTVAPTVTSLTVTTGTDVKWYAVETGGVALDATTVLVTGTTYYASQTLADCESPRTAVPVTINVTAAPTADAITLCEAGTVEDLKVTTGTDVKWYAAETGGDALATTANLATGTYYVSQTLADCESPRTAVVVTISETVKPEGEATQNFTEGQTIADLDVTGDDVVWYSDEALTQVVPDTTVLTNATTYYAVATIGTCESESLAVTVTKVLSTTGFDKAHFTFYPNPVKDVLTLSYNATINTVTVYNLLGQPVITSQVNASIAQINTAQLAVGTYIVKAIAGGKTQTFKVVKS